jgi:hypothetical protein
MAAYRKAAELAPDDLAKRASLAWGHFYHGSHREAAELVRRLTRTPGAEHIDPRWRLGFGQAEGWLGNTDRAMEIFLELAREKPTLIMRAWQEAAFFDLWHPLAQEILRLARTVDPSDEFLAGALLRPSYIFISNEHFEKALKNLDLSLDWLTQRKLRLRNPAGLDWVSIFHIFNSSGINLIPTSRKYSEFLAGACPELRQSMPDAGERPLTDKPDRLRLGIALNRVSSKRNHIDDGRIATAIISFLQWMDRTRFKMILFHPDDAEDNGNFRALTAMFDESHPVPASFAAEKWHVTNGIIGNAKLDILLHEDFGIYKFLGFSRLAPVQCQFFDCCFSMSLPATDYIVIAGKADWFADFIPFYSEKIAMFPSWLGWGNPGSEDSDATSLLEELGIPPSAKLMFSWYDTTQWLPKYDILLATLLRGNPATRLLLATHIDFNSLEKIKRRWRHSMPDVFDRVKFIPRQPFDRFHGILRRADAVLAPPFIATSISAGTTIAKGIPVVATFGGSMDSRLLPLAYDIIGVDGLTARDIGEYLAINQRLLDDRTWRDEKSREILANAHKLYDYGPAVNELMDFLEAAHERTRNGLPPAHWHSGRFWNG